MEQLARLHLRDEIRGEKSRAGACLPGAPGFVGIMNKDPGQPGARIHSLAENLAKTSRP